MKAWKLNRLVLAVVIVAGLAGEALAQSAPTRPARRVVVSLEDRKLALVEGGKVKKVYTVAVGKPSTPSPAGTFKIERRVKNPTYHHDGKTVLPGAGNPVGTRWMGLNKAGYGIHGTNEPRSIGKAASHGCIRMAKADLEEFYELIEVGDTVELVSERNEETARLFGDDQDPAAMQTADPVETASVGPDAGPLETTIQFPLPSPDQTAMPDANSEATPATDSSADANLVASR
jgi:hypothetical protein